MAMFDRFRKKNTEEPSNEEQMMRRQSAPRPTAQEEFERMRQQQPQSAVGLGLAPQKLPIGKEQVHKAQQILNTYKTGKANLEKRIVDNEEWYKLRHWECMRKSG